jgi:hypothetical protein
MNKTPTIILIASVLVLVLGYYGYTSFVGSGNEVVELAEETEQAGTPVSGTVVDEQEKEKKKSREEKKMEKEYPSDVDETVIQNAIHHMSHSMVHADKKWGQLEPTEERIERLLEVLEQNQSSYEHTRLYISILERWQKGDYSQAVTDHNQMWNLQGGTVGKATRLLSNEEINSYRKKHFD